MDFLDKVKTEFQRRCIVDLLAADPTDALNIHILSAALTNFGQDVQVDGMVSHTNWLVEAGLAEVVHGGPPIVLRVTDRGQAVAAGRIAVDGVARPMR